MQPFHLEACPGYVALSYTRSSPLRGEESIAQYDGVKRPINFELEGGEQWLLNSKSLWEALDHIEGHKLAIFVWANGTCINQGDQKEVESQVPLVGQIYSRSGKVNVWLGRVDADAKKFFHLHDTVIRKLHKYQATHDPQPLAWPLREFQKELQIQVPLKTWAAYNRFLEQRRWFSRVWVVQEIAVTNHIDVKCGYYYTNWKNLSTLGSLIRSGPTSDLQIFRIQRVVCHLEESSKY